MQLPETQTQLNPRNLDNLRQGRFDLAVAASQQELRSIFANNGIDNPDVSFVRVKDTDSQYDCGALPASELLALEALGVDLHGFLQKTGWKSGKDDEVIGKVEEQDEIITIERYSRGMSLKFRKEGRVPDNAHPAIAEAMKKKISARFAASPAHQALARVDAELQQSDHLPRSVSAEPFDPQLDPLGTAVFFCQIGLARNNYQLAEEMRHGRPVAEIVQSFLTTSLSHGVKVYKNEDSRIYTWGKGTARHLTVNKASGSLTFSASMSTASNYSETPNGAANIDAVPFVETECARELSKLLDASGLMFHPAFQSEMMSMTDSDRFGSVYTQFSREIAKWVNDPMRTRLSNLFMPYDAKYQGDALATGNLTTNVAAYDNKEHGLLVEQSVRNAWTSIDHNVDGEAASLLVGIIDGVLTRGTTDTAEPRPTDLPVTSQRYRIRDGACFDVAAYYIAAAGENRSNNSSRIVTDGDVSMLEKTYGSHTFMLTEPALFNGTPLPKGSLLSKHDDGYAFLRLTPFTFDNPTDQLALDPELAKARSNEAENIRHIGGVTMRHLTDAH